jgi:hypothetical protein
MTCSLQGKLQIIGAHLLLARTVAVTACGQELAHRTEVRRAGAGAGAGAGAAAFRSALLSYSSTDKSCRRISS